MPTIALPNKGRMFEDVRAVLADAGLEVRSAGERSLVAQLGDEFSAIFVRAQDIPAFVADGAADAGITGRDCVEEASVPLRDRLDLGFGKCRLVVAARLGADGRAPSLASLPEGLRVATSFPRVAGRFFAEHGKPVRLVEVSGAAEVTPHLGVADAIVDLVSSGSTLRSNGLGEVHTILGSSARLVSRADDALAPDVATQLDELTLALASVIRARGQRYLMANAPRAQLEAVRAELPGINGPTIVDVGGPAGAFVAVHAVVPQRTIYRTIARLKELGCEGILVTRIERLTP